MFFFWVSSTDECSASISLAKNSDDMEESPVFLIHWHLATASGEFIISTPLRMRKEGGVFVLILFAPSLLWATYLWKLNSCACMSASAAACVLGPSVFPGSVVAQCATDFSPYSDSQLSWIRNKTKKKVLLCVAVETTSKISTKCKMMPAWVCSHPPQWEEASQLSKKGGEQMLVSSCLLFMCTVTNCHIMSVCFSHRLFP